MTNALVAISRITTGPRRPYLHPVPLKEEEDDLGLVVAAELIVMSSRETRLWRDSAYCSAGCAQIAMSQCSCVRVPDYSGYHSLMSSFGKVFHVEKRWKLRREMGSGAYGYVM